MFNKNNLIFLRFFFILVLAALVLFYVFIYYPYFLSGPHYSGCLTSGPPCSYIASGFFPFVVTNQLCNSTGLFINLKLQPYAGELPISVDNVTIINATMRQTGGIKTSVNCTSACEGVGPVKIGQQTTLNFTKAGATFCTNTSYESDIRLWYSYNENSTMVINMLAGTVAGPVA